MFTRRGGRGGISIDYRDLIETTLAHGASKLLLIHNHPSGDPTPSTCDVEATRQLIALGRPLGINIYDHLVVGRHALVSMRRRGMI